MPQCEEPGCSRPATKKWHGRYVCEDHYDFYRDRDAKRSMDYLDF